MAGALFHYRNAQTDFTIPLMRTEGGGCGGSGMLRCLDGYMMGKKKALAISAACHRVSECVYRVEF